MVSEKSSLERCLIALGGNQTVSHDVFQQAMDRLSELGLQLVRLSDCFSTRPVGQNAGDEFLNAAAVVLTNLPADEVLRCLHQTEEEFGRKRTIHWGPRTLDLDLILYGQQVVCRPDLVVPHPAMWYRRFVLQPAAEIAGELQHPLLGCSVRELWTQLCSRPLQLEIDWSARQSASTDLPDSCRLVLLQRVADRWPDNQVKILEAVPETPLLPESCLRIRLIARPQPEDLEYSKQPRHSRSRVIDLIETDPTRIVQSVEEILDAMLG
jgi:2-amino-4-hydroxy-6-hydroxymethyldihydropteridine diphosphokinase